MTGDGCIQCNSGKMTQLFGISGGVVLFLIVSVFLFRRFSNRVKEDAKEQENEDDHEETEREEQVALPAVQENKNAKLMWKRARMVKHVVGFKMSAELSAATAAIGLEDIAAARDDAKEVLNILRMGMGRGQTQIKIAIGLSQILGELPTVLELKYPPLMNVYLGSLSFVKFDVFKIFKVDCLATTSVYTKFIATMFAPVFIVASLQLYKLHKQRKLKRARSVLGDRAIVSMSAKISSDVMGTCFAAVFFLCE